MGGQGSGRKPKQVMEEEKLTKGKNSEVAAFLKEVYRLGREQKIDLKNPEQVQDRLCKYLDLCEKSDMKPTQSGAALSCGISRAYWLKLLSGDRGATFPKETVEIMRDFNQVLNSYWEQQMVDGRINPVSGIFLGKNNFEGYRDVQEHRFSVDENVGASFEQLEAKYQRAIDVEFTEVTDD